MELCPRRSVVANINQGLEKPRNGSKERKVVKPMQVCVVSTVQHYTFIRASRNHPTNWLIIQAPYLEVQRGSISQNGSIWRDDHTQPGVWVNSFESFIYSFNQYF